MSVYDEWLGKSREARAQRELPVPDGGAQELAIFLAERQADLALAARIEGELTKRHIARSKYFD